MDDSKTVTPMPWNGPAEFPPRLVRLRGIRHLKRVSVARLRVGNEQCLYDTFFTLHEDLESEELPKPFYTSEIIYDSTNPQWCVFHENQFVNPPPQSEKKLVVCIWETFAGTPRRLLIKVRIDISELCFISTLTLDFPDSTLLFELHDGIYTTKNVRLQLEEMNIIVRHDLYADEDHTKRLSCSRASYVDIISKKRELDKKIQRAAELSKMIEEKKNQNKQYFEKLEMRNELEARLSSLKLEYESLNATFQKILYLEKQDLENRSAVLLPTVEKLKNAQIALSTSMQEMEQRRKELIAHHQQLTKTFFLIRKHQERLIRDLANIYRILPVRDANGNPQRPYTSASSTNAQNAILYCINGFPLNNSHFHGQDEEKIATGLGYVCHLLQLLSKYLDIPLRYPVTPMMSRSTIQDVVVNMERYPLYSKAQNIDHFRTGVALLNRNIEQLVLSQGLEPGPLRETLPNLKILIDSFLVDNKDIPANTPPETTSKNKPIEDQVPSEKPNNNPTE